MRDPAPEPELSGGLGYVRNLGFVSLTGISDGELTPKMKSDVERAACKMGGDAVSLNASGPGIFAVHRVAVAMMTVRLQLGAPALASGVAACTPSINGPAGDRAALESQRANGVVVVHDARNEMEVLRPRARGRRVRDLGEGSAACRRLGGGAARHRRHTVRSQQTRRAALATMPGGNGCPAGLVPKGGGCEAVNPDRPQLLDVLGPK